MKNFKNIITLVRVSGNDTYVSRSFEKIDDKAIATIRGCIEEDNETTFSKEEIEKCYAPSFATLKEDYAELDTDPTTDFEREGDCIWEYNDGEEVISYVLHVSIMEISKKTTSKWIKPRFTAKDILEGAHYEEAPYLKDIKDSMELDSDPVDLAYLKNTILARSNKLLTINASVRAVGEVKVFFKGLWYRNASKVPKELVQCYHDGTDPAMLDPDYYIDNNNWFEEFVKITVDARVVYNDSFVIDDPSGMESMAESILDIINEEEECLALLFKDNDSVRWEDPDESLAEQMTPDELKEYNEREFRISEKRSATAFIEDGHSQVEVLYSELFLNGK